MRCEEASFNTGKPVPPVPKSETEKFGKRAISNNTARSSAAPVIKDQSPCKLILDVKNKTPLLLTLLVFHRGGYDFLPLEELRNAFPKRCHGFWNLATPFLQLWRHRLDQRY